MAPQLLDCKRLNLKSPYTQKLMYPRNCKMGLKGTAKAMATHPTVAGLYLYKIDDISVLILILMHQNGFKTSITSRKGVINAHFAPFCTRQKLHSHY